MAGFIDERRREINDWLRDKPLVEEYERLEGAIEALSGVVARGIQSGAASLPHSAAIAHGTGPAARHLSAAINRAACRCQPSPHDGTAELRLRCATIMVASEDN